MQQTIYTQTLRTLPRAFSTSRSAPPTPDAKPDAKAETKPPPSSEPEETESALTRRFQALAEDALLASPSKASLTEELKNQLAERIAAADFASQNAQAISIANLPSSASKHTRDLAGARVWTGEEATEDAVLRMLTDVHKPIKTKAVPQTIVDLRPHNTFGPKPDRATRVESARDRSLEYSIKKDAPLSEKEELRAMFRERFTPGARPVATVSALMSLADQRIEDARARGQFDNIPRGKPRVEDHNARSPYMDTTEYFLNKMIQKQEVLPPWVEKQQELTKSVDRFRTRLRNDWRRFVARRIAAKGGSLEEQCRRAEEYAAAEARRVRLDRAATRMRLGEEVPPEEFEAENGPKTLFRDPEWESTELKYNTLAIDTLNELCRSYNMMAPSVARKPMFTLARELDRCYADVAPQVAEEIRSRANMPMNPKISFGSKPKASILSGLAGGGQTVHIHETDKPNYGFKEFWKDLFGKKTKE
jgi:hypothetical protein